jgi:hypothetical protein
MKEHKMIEKMKGELDTFSPKIYAGYSLDEIENELNNHGAVFVQMNCDYKCLYCIGNMYGPEGLTELKQLIDDLGLCAFGSRVETDLALAIYQVFRRSQTSIPRIHLTPPDDPAYWIYGYESLKAAKRWALDQLNGPNSPLPPYWKT